MILLSAVLLLLSSFFLLLSLPSCSLWVRVRSFDLENRSAIFSPGNSNTQSECGKDNKKKRVALLTVTTFSHALSLSLSLSLNSEWFLLFTLFICRLIHFFAQPSSTSWSSSWWLIRCRLPSSLPVSRCHSAFPLPVRCGLSVGRPSSFGRHKAASLLLYVFTLRNHQGTPH